MEAGPSAAAPARVATAVPLAGDTELIAKLVRERGWLYATMLELELGVDQHRVGNAQPRHRVAHRALGAAEHVPHRRGVGLGVAADQLALRHIGCVAFWSDVPIDELTVGPLQAVFTVFYLDFVRRVDAATRS